MSDQNFSTFSDEQIIEFIVKNVDLFTNNVATDFPKGLFVAMMENNALFLKRREGFAVVFRKIQSTCKPASYCASLEFLHVSAKHEGNGFGTLLVEEVKTTIPPTRSLELTCEGQTRKRIFEKMGFQETAFDSELDNYAMYWPRS